MRHTIKMLGLVLGLGLSACGPNGGGDASSKFIGTWHATSGTLTSLCPGYGQETGPYAGNVVWAEGVSSDLVMTDPSTGCITLADVSGATATGQPGQTCTASDGIGGVSTVSLNSYTFVVSPDGHTATENQSGTLTVVIEGATVVCSVSASAAYQKIGN